MANNPQNLLKELANDPGVLAKWLDDNGRGEEAALVRSGDGWMVWADAVRPRRCWELRLFCYDVKEQCEDCVSRIDDTIHAPSLKDAKRLAESAARADLQDTSGCLEDPDLHHTQRLRCEWEIGGEVVKDEDENQADREPIASGKVHFRYDPDEDKLAGKCPAYRDGQHKWVDDDGWDEWTDGPIKHDHCKGCGLKKTVERRQDRDLDWFTVKLEKDEDFRREDDEDDEWDEGDEDEEDR